ncbi:MAG: type II secretion system protein GspG [Bdellovibrionales bacterium]|nr:type II secretion system protein GspG [Bdellovibrionales bacterium]
MKTTIPAADAPLTIDEGERGMTLVELLVVIVLISLIAVVVGKNVIGQGDAAKAELNVVKMEKLKNLLGQYRLKFNSYPGALQELIKPSADTQKSGQLFVALAEEGDLNDVWGFPYIYKTENNGRSFTLSSLGADGIEGGDGAKQDVTVRP